ncbi:hypothetical protein DFH07DRAFT_836795 [Mycena maculata]|uniref:Uncharacterized protein n=1 Tax=Mycena maculata TaxID=230809 RepID=A0AAD7IFU0_9AGAR|nr:hypothetical protein DFH07DRAFT_836795 [Mycena maculata]
MPSTEQGRRLIRRKSIQPLRIAKHAASPSARRPSTSEAPSSAQFRSGECADELEDRSPWRDDRSYAARAMVAVTPAPPLSPSFPSSSVTNTPSGTRMVHGEYTVLQGSSPAPCPTSSVNTSVFIRRSPQCDVTPMRLTRTRAPPSRSSTPSSPSPSDHGPVRAPSPSYSPSCPTLIIAHTTSPRPQMTIPIHSRPTSVPSSSTCARPLPRTPIPTDASSGDYTVGLGYGVGGEEGREGEHNEPPLVAPAPRQDSCEEQSVAEFAAGERAREQDEQHFPPRPSLPQPLLPDPPSPYVPTAAVEASAARAAAFVQQREQGKKAPAWSSSPLSSAHSASPFAFARRYFPHAPLPRKAESSSSYPPHPRPITP